MDNRKLVIAYVLESTPLCGGVKVVFSQARELLRRGHDTVIIAPDNYPEWFEERLPFRRHDPLDPMVLKGFDCIIATSPKLVMGLSPFPGVTKKMWHLVQGYEGDLPEAEPFLDLIRNTYLLPNPKLTISNRLADRLGQMFPGRPFHPIGQGIEHQYFFPSRKNVDLSVDPIDRVFLVGPMSISIKRIAAGLDAYRRIREQFPMVKLVRISQVDTRTEEEALIGPIGDYHVNIRPREVGEIMRSGSGILISPSGPGEGFGLPVLEAMACGIPSVLSAIPSYKSFSRTCDYAYFVSDNGPEAMAERVCRLITDDSERMRLAKRGCEVATQYSFEKVAENLERVLTHTLPLHGKSSM